MKKVVFVASALAVLGLVGVSIWDRGDRTQAVRYADVRLSVLQLQEGTEFEIQRISKHVFDKQVIPTNKELTLLIQSIKTLRTYGKDINKEAKKQLKDIVQHLKKIEYNNRILLQQIDKLAKTSQILSV